MTALVTVAYVVLAAVWVLVEARQVRPPRQRLLVLAWQLAALSFVPGPDWLGGDRGPQVVAAVLVLAAAGATIVALVSPPTPDGGDRPGPRTVAIAPWIVVFAVVLAVAAATSGSPAASWPRSIRVVLLLVVFAQTAVWLDRAVARQLFTRFVGGLATLVVAGAALAPDDAFQSLAAPIVRVALAAPALGSGPHVVGWIGLALLATVVWRQLDGLGPEPGSGRWLALVPGPTLVGVALLLLAQKRAFWLAAAVATLVGLALCWRRLLLPAIVVLAAVVAVATLVGPVRDLWDREQARPQADNITSIRGGIFEASLDRWRERPIVGNGLGVGDRDLLIDVGQPGHRWNSHDEIGASLAATGVLGLAALAWGHLVGLAGARRVRRRSGDPWPLIVVAGSFALLPFWRLYVEPVVVALPLLTVVFPTHRWWHLGLDRWLPGRHPAPATTAETGSSR